MKGPYPPPARVPTNANTVVGAGVADGDGDAPKDIDGVAAALIDADTP